MSNRNYIYQLRKGRYLALLQYYKENGTIWQSYRDVVEHVYPNVNNAVVTPADRVTRPYNVMHNGFYDAELLDGLECDAIENGLRYSLIIKPGEIVFANKITMEKFRRLVLDAAMDSFCPCKARAVKLYREIDSNERPLLYYHMRGDFYVTRFKVADHFYEPGYFP